jgi:3-methyladenine DNA glycosylase AlkD
MNAKEADALGQQVARLAHGHQVEEAYALLAPVLAQRTPFRLLDRIGARVDCSPDHQPVVADLLDRIAAERTEGGWVVIASALGQCLAHDLKGTCARCRSFVIEGDVWYVADILGERVPGPALVDHFGPALSALAPWRTDDNRWVRRAVGVAVHFWAKRSRGAPDLRAEASRLLEFLEPMFGEWEMDAVKGVGWGLKTLGRHYPDQVADWLVEQVVHQGRRHRALMLRKALTFLSEEKRARLT